MAKIGNDNKNTTEYRFKTLIAGGIAGCAAKTVVAPLDRIKILFQTHHQHYIHYQNIRLGYWQALREIQRNNGVRGLFRGHSATLLRIFPYAGVKFMAYEQFKNIIMPTKTHETSGRNFVCGALAGVCASFVTYPFDLIRTRVAFEVKSIPLREVTVNIYREGGVSAFFQGISPTLIGMVPYAGISFLTYESLKKRARSIDEFVNNQGHTDLKPLITLGCGALSGMIAQTFSYPIEVIRKHMQVSLHQEHSTILKTTVNIYKQRGLRGYFAGLTIGYVKVTPMFAVSFYTYEYMKSVMSLA